MRPDHDRRESQLTVREDSAGSKKELREVSTTLREIRVSPWTLNLVTKLARDLPVVDAMAQMEFCKKKHTATVQRIIKVSCRLSCTCRTPPHPLDLVCAAERSLDEL